MFQRAIGPDQVLVVYTSRDVKDEKGDGLSVTLLERIADDGERRAAEGWEIAAWDSHTMETTGSGSWALHEKPVDIAVTVIYRRANQPAG